MAALGTVTIPSISVTSQIIALFITIIVSYHSKFTAWTTLIIITISKIIITRRHIARFITNPISKHFPAATRWAIFTNS
ncbi:unnamed protein product [Blepharisma stoltei]|uniref:Uncharacterized protein n=1 Tax=Blepharisma stoltei TaxID=1481888 RepID=A0AAU9J1L1_9CILI|nr:unnamed protein product [Blepharisma stoltei]